MRRCFLNIHTLGKMLFDQDENPYKVCQNCGARVDYKKKTLADMDKMTMKEIESMMGRDDFDLEDVMNMVYSDPFCKNCGGVVQLVEPVIVFNALKLYECPTCHERRYK